MSRKRTYTPEDRATFAAKRQATMERLSEQLKAEMKKMNESESFCAYLRFQAKFYRYSVRNVLLLRAQCPEATRIAGFETWRECGRFVRKGETGLRIYAPVSFLVQDDAGQPTTERRAGFKAVSVFDLSQTDGEDIPVERPALADMPDVVLATALAQVAQVSGVATPQQSTPTLQQAHALVAALARTLDAQTENGAPESERATVAEGVAVVILSHYDRTSGDVSFPAIAQWADSDDGQVTLLRVMERIQKITQRVIDALESHIPIHADDQPVSVAPVPRPAPTAPPVHRKPGIAAKLRTLAEAMQPQIDAKRNPVIASQRVTARRARIADGMLAQAQELEKTQTALVALADAHDAGTLHPSLLHLDQKTTIETLLHSQQWPQWEQEQQRVRRAKISAAHYAEARAALLALLDGRIAEPPPVAVEIRKRERDLLGVKIPGYFPTPRPLGDDLVSVAGLRPGLRILEPSAGKGDLAEAIREACPTCALAVIERMVSLREILTLKGFDVIGSDFLEHRSQWDRIIMNPPFEDGQDMAHVQHAYDCLAPGGRLVAIMSRGAGRSPTRATAFAAWLDDVDADVRDLPDDAFVSSDRPTSVRTRLIVVDKPDAQERRQAA